MKAKDLLVEFYSPEDDEQLKAEMSDTRRPRLTLRHLNKLRKMREMQALDNAQHSQFVKQMYGDSGGGEEGGGGMEEF